MYRIASFIFILLLSFSAVAQTEGIEFKMSIKPDSILVGDQVKLEVWLSYPKTDSISLPMFEDKVAQGIDFVEMGEPLIKDAGNKIELKIDYVVTSFDSGQHVLPYFPMLLHKNRGSQVDTLQLGEPITLKVGVVKVDEGFEGYDIKGIKKYPFDWRIILVILLIAIVIGIVVWKLVGRERLKSVLSMELTPQRPPHEIALEDLSKVKVAKVWQQGKIKEYYTDLTDIIRKYIEDTSGVQTFEKTSEEILDALAETSYNKNDLTVLLKDLFYYADLVKFAKYNPTDADNEINWQRASDYVNKSMQIQKEKPLVVNEVEPVKEQE